MRFCPVLETKRRGMLLGLLHSPESLRKPFLRFGSLYNTVFNSCTPGPLFKSGLGTPETLLLRLPFHLGDLLLIFTASLGCSKTRARRCLELQTNTGMPLIVKRIGPYHSFENLEESCAFAYCATEYPPGFHGDR